MCIDIVPYTDMYIDTVLCIEVLLACIGIAYIEGLVQTDMCIDIVPHIEVALTCIGNTHIECERRMQTCTLTMFYT